MIIQLLQHSLPLKKLCLPTPKNQCLINKRNYLEANSNSTVEFQEVMYHEKPIDDDKYASMSINNVYDSNSCYNPEQSSEGGEYHLKFKFFLSFIRLRCTLSYKFKH